MAIAAGFVGKPAAVCFPESTATLDCELWKYFTQIAGPSRVLHVYGKPDVKRLEKYFGQCRLVIVHAPRLRDQVAWAVQMRGSATLPRPAIFSIGDRRVKRTRFGAEMGLTLKVFDHAGCRGRGLSEELSMSSSQFRSLPTANELFLDQETEA